MYDHLREHENMINETGKLLHEIALSKVRHQVGSRGGVVQVYEVILDHPDVNKLRDNLQFLYKELGMGYKLLAKEFGGNATYSRVRRIFRDLDLHVRTGMSCVTDGLKKLRSERATKNNPWKDWAEKYPQKDMHHKHHLCGWYYNQSLQKSVYLRSSWEYCYAKWLDTQDNLTWDVEARSYLLNDGRYYRPDFFVYRENRLSEIVEIKARWNNGAQNRIDKFHLFQEQYPNVCARLVDHEVFRLTGSNQDCILREWKILRMRNKNMNNQDGATNE